MLVLPIPLIVSLILSFLLLHAALKKDRPWLFLLLLAACALQGVVISLAQYYGLTGLRLVQPVTATIIPPLAFATFQATAVRRFDPRRALPHLAGPVFTAFCVVSAPVLLDLVVPGLFLAYGAAILVAVRAGADSLPLTRLETADRPGRVWSVIALALILSAVSDGLIGVLQFSGAGWTQPLIISLFSSLSLGLVGALCLSQSLAGGEAPAEEKPAVGPTSEDVRQDAEIMARLDALVAEGALYLDADLTLERLSRRLLVPAKRLSTAINRTTSENVSRYVNGFRIRHACARLTAGESVTAAMLDSGFNTKSNFNREFLRVTGMAPGAWQAAHAADAPRRVSTPA
ncbi:helix-turn-helix domain-containing protein [Aurantimonas coralicida]|uniref:helix-turn-helix domain-containing protein n=1 Tax=Aurantimonas coralicida TaxID=182270 RepID=UPI001D196FA7|nr:helix-turn-helix domain-containing protein [Aurantimonas coralicida]MCC4297973.1 helix-turn-helix domain-containing protein [Aurantimonas coralicida]